MRSEQEILSELKDLCVQDGYLNAISYFCFKSGYIFCGEEITSEDLINTYSKKNLIGSEIKTLLGFSIKNGINTNSADSHLIQSYIDRTNNLLDELHKTMVEKAGIELFGDFPNSEMPVRKEKDFPNSYFREAIFYSGMSAYNFQFADFAIDKYFNDNERLIETFGISIYECIEICNTISEITLANVNASFNNFDSLKEMFTDNNFLINLFKFSKSNILSKCSVNEDSIDIFLSLFSVDEDERNTHFNELHDFNIIQAKPLLKISSNEYLSLDSSFIFQSIYESPFYWFMQDHNHKDIAIKNRGKFAEEFTYKQLRKVFGDSNVFMNLEIYSSPNNRLGEMDILVQYSDRLIIIQTKSKGLTLAAQKCNDDTLKDDFRKAVQDAYNQGLICSNAILDNKNYIVGTDGSRFKLNNKINDIFIFCLTSSHYPALTVQSAHFLEYQTNSIIHPPYVMDIFFLDVLCEFLDNPLYFMSYLKKRLRYLKKLRVSSEHSVLGYHLTRNLYIDEKYSGIVLEDDLAQHIDTSFLARRTNAPAEKTPEGILTRLKNTPFDELITQIKDNTDPSIIKFGEILLELSEDTIIELTNHLEAVAKDTKVTGVHHDYTILNDSFGITIHCNKRDYKEAYDSLKRHCENRKYTQQVHQYYGACVDENFTIRFCLSLDYPFYYSQEMDMRTNGLPNHKAQQTDQHHPKNSSKIGRNDPCPCGSGLKYKKCCLRK